MNYTYKTKDFKELIGQEIGLIPCGNAARNSNEKEVIKAILCSVGTKKITFKIESKFGLNDEGAAYAINGEYDKHNYGYYAFPSYQDALNYIEGENIVNWIKYKDGLKNVSFEKIKKIEAILLEK
jgi:hypothetical protein